MAAGRLRDRVQFQQRADSTDDFGGLSNNWVIVFERPAQFIHVGGDEAVEAARLAGREIYKLRVRSSERTRALSPANWRLRDIKRNTMFNIISVDAVTDRAWVWLRVEQTTVSGTTYDTGGIPLVTPPDSELFENLPELP